MKIKLVRNPFLITKLILGYLTFFAPPPINKYIMLIRGVKFLNIFNTWIGYGSLFDNSYPELIEIGENVVISSGVKILAHTELPKSINKLGIKNKINKTIIKSNVFIGAGSIILPGVRINEFSVIAAGSIVTKDVPRYTIFAGNPAKLIKEIKN